MDLSREGRYPTFGRETALHAEMLRRHLESLARDVTMLVATAAGRAAGEASAR